MNRAGNVRHQTTDAKLQETLLFLLERKPLKAVTVKELCESAQINKATFYRHYQDIYELAKKTEQNIQSGLVGLLDTTKERRLMEAVGQEELIAILAYIGENAVFYREYLKAGYDEFLDERFLTLWENYFKRQFQAVGVTQERRMQYYYRFFRAGMMTTILYWLETGQQETPQEVASIVWNMHFRWSFVEGRGKELVRKE